MNVAYEEIPGLVSRSALADHVELYRLEMAVAQHETLTRADASALGGAMLHEVYFAGLTPRDRVLLDTGPLRAVIDKKYASVDGWWQNFMREAAMRARGWAVVAVRGSDLRIFVLDAHDEGAVFGWSPIIAVDCYEHAYWKDFGTRKGEYLDAVYEHLNWPMINARYALV